MVFTNTLCKKIAQCQDHCYRRSMPDLMYGMKMTARSVISGANITTGKIHSRVFGEVWASFFKAKMCEELKTIAHNNPDFQEAVATVYQLA